MSKQEHFFSERSRYTPDNTRGLPINTTWYDAPDLYDFKRLERDLAASKYRRSEETMSLVRLPCFYPTIFASQPGPYLDTLHAVGWEDAADPADFSHDAVILQAGWKAYIVLNRTARIDDSESPDYKYFITYVSPEPVGSPTGLEVVADYHNLRELNRLMERLKPDIRQKVKVVKPFSLGEAYSEWTEKKYPFFTMEYIPPPYGELWCHNARVWIPIHENGERILGEILFPFLSYVSAYTEEMEGVNKRCFDAMIEMQNRIHRITDPIAATGHPQRRPLSRDSYKEVDSMLYELYGPYMDLLFADALIFALTERRFPKEHCINAGDWLGIIHPDDSLDLCLTSVRGGWRQFLSDEEWIRYIREEYSEEVLEQEKRFITFSHVSEETVRSILNKAREAIVKDL